MKFNVSATDGQTKIVATMLANTEEEARKAFDQDWGAKNPSLKITKITGPLGYPKHKRLCHWDVCKSQEASRRAGRHQT